ncbi:MAG: N-acetyltransferase [Oscillospiraceae bacterium]|nr:N-acetyltransferase [Oscillospiraceae bacterium]
MVRKAVQGDLQEILRVYRAAKDYMIRSGNPNQWEEGYPACMLEGDIQRGQLYVICAEDGTIHGVFAFIIGEDPTYEVIENGAWKSGERYGTIHRLGSDGEKKDIFSLCLNFCKGAIPYIRADTHHDNKTMQHVLEKHGFVPSGIIHIYDGSPRIAYEFFA